MAWVQYNKIPIYPIFYLLKGDYKLSNPAPSSSTQVWHSGASAARSRSALGAAWLPESAEETWRLGGLGLGFRLKGT